MQQVKISDLRSHLPNYIKRVNAGEQIQITSHGKVKQKIITFKQFDSTLHSMMISIIPINYDKQSALLSIIIDIYHRPLEFYALSFL